MAPDLLNPGPRGKGPGCHIFNWMLRGFGFVQPGLGTTCEAQHPHFLAVRVKQLAAYHSPQHATIDFQLSPHNGPVGGICDVTYSGQPQGASMLFFKFMEHTCPGHLELSVSAPWNAPHLSPPESLSMSSKALLRSHLDREAAFGSTFIFFLALTIT